MGILEELEPKRNMAVVIAEYLATLDKKERDEWETALCDVDRYTNRALAAAFNRRGLNVNESAIYRFRMKLREARNAR